MAEENNTSAQEQQGGKGAVTGDISNILAGIGSMLENAVIPLSTILAQTLDSMTVVAHQILEGISSTIGEDKGR